MVNAEPIDLKALQGQHLAGRFFLKRLLGQGGYGAVFEAEQTSVGRRCAVKVLSPRDRNDRKVIERFKMEARATSRLTHPNSVTIYDFGEDEEFGVLFIAMEYLEGQDLSEYIKEHPVIPVEVALHILEQAAASLDDAHQHGLVHRDVKPQNVMVLQRGRDPHFVKVIDFGIAKAMEATGLPPDTQLTMTGTIIGTPQYMSPEQVRDIELDGRSDQYSLAVVLYVLLTGRPPFLGTSPIDIATKHLTDQPLPPTVLRSDLDVPQKFEDAVMKALAKDPANRFPSTVEFAIALRAGLAGRTPAELRAQPVPELPTSPVEMVPEISTAPIKPNVVQDVSYPSDNLPISSIPSYGTEAISAPEQRGDTSSAQRLPKLVFDSGDSQPLIGKGHTTVVDSADLVMGQREFTAEIAPSSESSKPISETSPKTGIPTWLKGAAGFAVLALVSVLVLVATRVSTPNPETAETPIEEPVEVAEVLPVEDPKVRDVSAKLEETGKEEPEIVPEPEPPLIEEEEERPTETAQKLKPVQKVEAKPDKETLEKGKVSVTLIPWGTLYVGRRAYSDSPRQVVDLPTGRHRLHLKQNGEIRASKTVDVVAGQTRMLVLNANAP